MLDDALSRRDFVRDLGRLTGGTWLAWALPVVAGTAAAACEAHETGAPLRHLSADQGALVRSVAACILPSDDTPGAEECGVVYFVDQALGTFFAGPGATALLDGLAVFDASVQETHGSSFPQLPESDQIAALTEAEAQPFFGILRFLTLAGAFSHPKYGGNRDRLGWQLVGFTDRHVWSPPFGHYDRDAHGSDAPSRNV